MPIGKEYDYARLLWQLIRDTKNTISQEPMNLGGIAGSGGGSSYRPYHGYLPQNRVAFDLTEAADPTIPDIGILPPSGQSLVTNLNRIRAGVTIVSSGIHKRHLFFDTISPSGIDAADIPIIDAADNFVAVNVEDALAELAAKPAGLDAYQYITIGSGLSVDYQTIIEGLNAVTESYYTILDVYSAPPGGSYNGSYEDRVDVTRDVGNQSAYIYINAVGGNRNGKWTVDTEPLLVHSGTGTGRIYIDGFALSQMSWDTPVIKSYAQGTGRIYISRGYLYNFGSQPTVWCSGSSSFKIGLWRTYVNNGTDDTTVLFHCPGYLFALYTKFDGDVHIYEGSAYLEGCIVRDGKVYVHPGATVEVTANCSFEEGIENLGGTVNYRGQAGLDQFIQQLDGITLPEATVTTPASGYGIYYVNQSGLPYFRNDAGVDYPLYTTFSGTTTDELVKVSSNDTTADYLRTKLVAGSGITLTELNDGSNETLRIAANTLRIREQDGTPDVSGVVEIRVTNDTLTDEGSGIVSLDTGGGITTYTTVALAEAASGVDNDICYVVETDTFYRYEATGSSYTVDNTYVLSTGDGGDTRWLGIAGQYTYGQVASETHLKTEHTIHSLSKVIDTSDSPYTVNDSEVKFIGVDTSSGDVTITFADISTFTGNDVDEVTIFKTADDNIVHLELAVPSQSLGDFSTYNLQRKGHGINVIRNRERDTYWFTPVGANATTTLPTVVTYAPTLVGTTLSMEGELTDMADNNSLTVYFEYRQSGTSTWTATTGQVKTSVGTFSDTATVTAGLTYEVRAVAELSNGSKTYGAIRTTAANYYPTMDIAKDDGLIRYWALQETSGTDTDGEEWVENDTMRFYNGVTIGNDTINGNTIYKRIFGTDDYGEASFTMNRDGQYTFLLQIRANLSSGDHTYMNNGANFLSLAGDNTDVQLESGSTVGTWSSALPFTGVKNLFVTYDYNAWKVELYEVDTSTATNRITLWSMPSWGATAQFFRIGRGASGDSNHQDDEYLDDGEVRSVAIWNRVLDTSEMVEIVKVLDTDGGLLVQDTSYEPVPAEHGVNASIKDHRDVDSNTDPTDGQILRWDSTNNYYTPSDSLIIKEQDGSPSVTNVLEIRVSNGTLTDEGNGVVSLVTGGGSGSTDDLEMMIWLEI